MKNLFVFILFISQFSCSQSQNIAVERTIKHVNTSTVKKDLKAITTTDKPRNYKNIKSLNSVANYINKELKKVCDTVSFQEYKVESNNYKNVIGSIGIENKERIIIGAHYDVAGDSDGADDNASGIAGLLELARLLSNEKLKYRIDFVAYTLEEPPFFRTKQMGSYIHAKYLFDNQISVKGMICLETIGYFSDVPNSQKYPIKGMELIYGNKGNYIAIVQNGKEEMFGNEITKLMKEQKLIETKSIKGSSLINGIDFSDHLNYWNFGYEAVMITNTAFYRNLRYHTSNDKMETLDIQRMCNVVEQLYQTIKKIR